MARLEKDRRTTRRTGGLVAKDDTQFGVCIGKRGENGKRMFTLRIRHFLPENGEHYEDYTMVLSATEARNFSTYVTNVEKGDNQRAQPEVKPILDHLGNEINTQLQRSMRDKPSVVEVPRDTLVAWREKLCEVSDGLRVDDE